MVARHIQSMAIICLAIASVEMTSCGDGSSSIDPTLVQGAAAITQVASATQAAPTAAPSVTAQPTAAPEATATELLATNTAAPATITSAPAARPAAQPPAIQLASPVADSRSTNPALAVVQRAREDLARQLGIDADVIELLSVRRRFKPTGVSDSPGKAIGWDIRLGVGNQAYQYQVDANGALHRR